MQESTQPVQQEATFSLSPQQAFLFNLNGAPPVSQCVLLQGSAPPQADLHVAVEKLVATNEILRTTFVTPSGARSPIGQTIHDQLPPDFVSESDLSGQLLDDPAALDALLVREAEAVSDAQPGPPLRVCAVRLTSGECLVVLTALAACADARSLLAIAKHLSHSDGASATDPIQHADYAEWRAELIGSDDGEAVRGRNFWQRAADVDPPQPLLFGRSGEHRFPRTKLHVPIALESAELDAVRAGGSEYGFDPPLFALAAWCTLLNRLSGASDVLVASVADGRAQPDLADAVGPYAQTVPVRVRFGPETRFAEVIDQVRRGRSEAERLQDFGSDADLAQLAQRAAGGFASAGVVPVSGVIAVHDAVPACPIGLEWHTDGAGELWADSALYDREDVEDIALELRTLMAAAASDPAEEVSRLRILEEPARARALSLGAEPSPPLAGDCIHHSFEEQVLRTPDLPAVRSGQVALTFAELNRRANQIAHHLLALGVEPREPVGLCMTRSPEMLASALGILKSGSGYVPLNFSHPSERIAHQLAESGTQIVITETSLVERLPAGSHRIVCVDKDNDEIAKRPDANPQRTVDPDDLAYVIYTSGSTGMPKGVAVTHGNLGAYCAAICERLNAREGMHYAVVSEISTDLGNTTIFPPLATGGCVHLIGPEMAMDGAALADFAREHPFDVIKITPSHLRALLAASEQVLPERCLVVGGEALSWDLVRSIRATGARCRVINHYGPTETTVGCCTFEVADQESGGPAATVPIGRPLPGVRVYVLDRYLEPVPVGAVGELFVAGVGVSRGYVRRPDETSTRFIPEVDGGAAGGARMYRTGDRVRFLRDGSIEFVGRVDDQVKIRGHRVEPGEVEATILRHPQVREAAVVAREDEKGELGLIAYIVASTEQTTVELPEFVGQTLPEHMVPRRFIAMESLPLTPSGKVDRHALPDPASVQVQRSATFVAPRDELETEIAGIWAELLGVSEVGVRDDFFALGGHSLMATQVIMRVRRRYGNIPLGALFNSPTVAALADVIRATTADH